MTDYKTTVTGGDTPGEGTSLPIPAKPAIASYPPTDSGFTTFIVLETLGDEALDALDLPPNASYFVRKEQYDEIYSHAKLTDQQNRSLRRELSIAQEAASDAQKEVENTREFWNTAHSGLHDSNREKIEFVDANPPTLAARMDAIVVGFELLWKQNKELANQGVLNQQNIAELQASARSFEGRIRTAEQEFPAQLSQIRRILTEHQAFTARSLAMHGKFARKLAKKVRKLQRIP